MTYCQCPKPSAVMRLSRAHCPVRFSLAKKHKTLCENPGISWLSKRAFLRTENLPAWLFLDHRTIDDSWKLCKCISSPLSEALLGAPGSGVECHCRFNAWRLTIQVEGWMNRSSWEPENGGTTAWAGVLLYTFHSQNYHVTMCLCILLSKLFRIQTLCLRSNQTHFKSTGVFLPTSRRMFPKRSEHPACLMRLGEISTPGSNSSSNSSSFEFSFSIPVLSSLEVFPLEPSEQLGATTDCIKTVPTCKSLVNLMSQLQTMFRGRSLKSCFSKAYNAYVVAYLWFPS